MTITIIIIYQKSTLRLRGCNARCSCQHCVGPAGCRVSPKSRHPQICHTMLSLNVPVYKSGLMCRLLSGLPPMATPAGVYSSVLFGRVELRVRAVLDVVASSFHHRRRSSVADRLLGWKHQDLVATDMDLSCEEMMAECFFNSGSISVAPYPKIINSCQRYPWWNL